MQEISELSDILSSYLTDLSIFGAFMFISYFKHMFILIIFIYLSHITIFITGLDSEKKECGISTTTNLNYNLQNSKATLGAWPWVAVRFVNNLNCNINYFIKECVESSTKNT